MRIMASLMARYGFVGLGVMGAPMAGHALAAGLDLTVWSRSGHKLEPLRTQGAKVAGTLAELGTISDVVALCVTGTEDVQECCSILATKMASGCAIVDHSTILPAAARKLHEALALKGISFVDAPITGGSMGARKGTLTAFCGGDKAAIDAVRPLLDAYCRRAERVGGPGQGQLMKAANQIAVGGALLALCESLAFAEKAGLDLAQTRELLAGGAAGSWAFDNYGPKILDRDWTPGFSIRNQTKDFRYCLESARELDAAIPGTELALRLLSRMEGAGRGPDTTAALFEEILGRGFEG